MGKVEGVLESEDFELYGNVGAQAVDTIARALSGISEETDSDSQRKSSDKDKRDSNSEHMPSLQKFDSMSITAGDGSKFRRRSSKHWDESVYDTNSNNTQSGTTEVISSAAEATSAQMTEKHTSAEIPKATEDVAENRASKHGNKVGLKKIVTRKVRRIFKTKPVVHMSKGVIVETKQVSVPVHSFLLGESPIPYQFKELKKNKKKMSGRSRRSSNNTRVADVKVKKRSTAVKDIPLQPLPENGMSPAVNALQQKFSEMRTFSKNRDLHHNKAPAVPPREPQESLFQNNYPVVHRYYVTPASGKKRRQRSIGGDDEPKHRPYTMADFVPNREGLKAALFGQDDSLSSNSNHELIGHGNKKMASRGKSRRKSRDQQLQVQPEELILPLDPPALSGGGFFKKVSDFLSAPAMANSALSRRVDSVPDAGWLFGRMFIGSQQMTHGSPNNHEDTVGYAASSPQEDQYSAGPDTKHTGGTTQYLSSQGPAVSPSASDATATEHTLSQDPFEAYCGSSNQGSPTKNSKKTKDELVSEETSTSKRLSGGSDVSECAPKMSKAQVMFEQAKSMMNLLKLLRDEIVYIKEDIFEIQTMHDCCGVDEVMTSRARAKNRTAFPEGPTIQLESEPYAYQIVAYKTVLNIWAKEYVDEEVERRKLDKKSVLLRGMRLQKHLKEHFICDPALIMSRDLRLEVQRAEHLLGVELDRVRTLERNIPRIVELVRRLVCSWQKKKYLQEVIQVLSGHLRASPDGDTAITHMLELMEPSTDSYDFLRLFYSNLDGTSITETNPAMEPTFEPQLGHGVNFCEAKKLIHFMKYRHLHPWFKFPKKNKLGGAGLDVNDYGFKDFMKDDRFNFEHMIPQQQRGVEMGARRFRVMWDRRAKTALYKAMTLTDSIRSLEHNMQLDYKAPRTVGDLFPHVAFVQRLDIDEALVSKPPTVEKYGIPEVSTRSPNFN